VKRSYHTDAAPQAIGPYSQAVEVGGFVFVSGQIPLEPQSQQLVSGSFEQQAKQALQNVQAILQETGCHWTDVVKTTVYLTDLSNFPVFNAIYETYLSPPFPARSTVQVAALPKGASLEIDVIAKKSFYLNV